jgi:hypothetical protein
MVISQVWAFLAKQSQSITALLSIKHSHQVQQFFISHFKIQVALQAAQASTISLDD